MIDDIADMVSKALTRAWGLGQTYWQQADSDFSSQHRKSEDTEDRFKALVDQVRATVISELEALQARVAELEKDAARYRWLRAGRMEFGVQPDMHPGLSRKEYWWCVDWTDPVTQVDQRIDTAMAASKEAP